VADVLGVVIFSGLSNVSSAVFQYRLNTNSLGNALVGNFKVSKLTRDVRLG
jgi:hypothetical protein